MSKILATHWNIPLDLKRVHDDIQFLRTNGISHISSFDLQTIYIRIYCLFSFNLFKYIQILLKLHSWRYKSTLLFQLKVRTACCASNQNGQKGLILNSKDYKLSLLTKMTLLLTSNQVKSFSNERKMRVKHGVFVSLS